MSAHIDFESRSPVNLRAEGVYRYFAHAQTEIMIASYCLDDGPVKRWRLGEPCPAGLRAHIESGALIFAHNAAFERLAMQMILAPRHGWPRPALEQFVCTAATAAALSLPRDLDGVGRALGLKQQKDKEGHKLMMKMSQPRKARKDEPEGLYFYGWDEPAVLDRLHDYCDQDVLTERAAEKRMTPLSDDMRALYWASERINDRGVRIDRDSARAALKMVALSKRDMDKELWSITGGAVGKGSQVAKLKAWVESRGVAMAGAAKADIEEILELEDLPDDVRRAVEIRQEYGKTSVSKLVAMLARCGDDGRIRGPFLFHAASTGRFSSVGAQLHNMTRPRKMYGKAELNRETLFKAIRTANPEALPWLYGPKLGRPMLLISDVVRSFIWAGPKKELLVADYSSIEGRGLAWGAGEEWKLQAYRDIDSGLSKYDLYEQTAAGVYGVSVEDVDDGMRQAGGKVSELSLGYQGGVGAYYSMSRNYGIKMPSLYGPAWSAASPERRDKAVERYEECCKRGEETTKNLTREGWLAAELIKVGWREANPAIKASWKLLGDAAWDAVSNPGMVVKCLKASFVVARGFLWMKLPSGRCLAYGAPAIREVIVPWADKTVDISKRERAPAVTACSVDATTKQWKRGPLYGGLLAENWTQAVAFDLLANGIVKAEAAGYPIILHVHDEPGAEVDQGFGDVHAFEKLICELPAWADGLPLTAEGWRGKRYRK